MPQGEFFLVETTPDKNQKSFVSCSASQEVKSFFDVFVKTFTRNFLF